MEEGIDLTLNRKIGAKNTFQSVFPVYAPQFSNFTSTSKSTHSQSVDFSGDSDFVVHNKEIQNKTYNKKADRMVHYTEAMLRVKNMRAIKK